MPSSRYRSISHFTVGIEVVLPGTTLERRTPKRRCPRHRDRRDRQRSRRRSSRSPPWGAFFSVKMDHSPVTVLKRLAPAVRGGPDVVVFDGHPVDNVVDQAAVELVPVVEPSTAEPGQPAAEQAQPDLARLRMNVDGADHPPRQAVLLAPGADAAGPLVQAGQPAFRTDPDVIAVDFDREDVIVGQPVFGGVLFPFGCRRRAGRCYPRRRPPGPAPPTPP